MLKSGADGNVSPESPRKRPRLLLARGPFASELRVLWPQGTCPRGDHVSPPGRTHTPPRLTDSAAGSVVRALPLLPAPRREPRCSRGSLKCPLQDVAGVGTRSLGKTPPCSGLREGRPPRTAGPALRHAVRDLGLRPARCHASEVTSVETERLLLPPPEALQSTGPGLPAGQLQGATEMSSIVPVPRMNHRHLLHPPPVPTRSRRHLLHHPIGWSPPFPAPPSPLLPRDPLPILPPSASGWSSGASGNRGPVSGT